MSEDGVEERALRGCLRVLTVLVGIAAALWIYAVGRDLAAAYAGWLR